MYPTALVVHTVYHHLNNHLILYVSPPPSPLFRKVELGASNERDLLTHTNRVFSCLFHPKDEHVIVTGGWDRTVMIWDTRQRQPVNHISGPYLTGDGLTFSSDGCRLYSASYDPKVALDCWDFRSLAHVWKSSGSGDTHLYSCQVIRMTY